MQRRARPDAKAEALRERGSLNPHPEQVRDERFRAGEFFDPRDVVQVKYEMVRRARIEGQPAARAAGAFGFSRPSFYSAERALETGGLPALVPAKPGPRRAHKLSEDVMDFVERRRRVDPSLRATDLAPAIYERFGLRVHPRSIERAIGRREKKRP
ncbi:MAG: helix-turn-helix domain-containing protein [bacterium]